MENLRNEQWKRLEAVIKRSKMTINRFAVEIGLGEASSLYGIKRGMSDLTESLADRVCAAFPDVSKEWLLTGEGSMLSE